MGINKMEEEDIPQNRDHWTSQEIIDTAKGAGIPVSSKAEALSEIGKRLSIWQALLGSIKVSLKKPPEENPLSVIEEVSRLVKDNEDLRFENRVLKGEKNGD